MGARRRSRRRSPPRACRRSDERAGRRQSRRIMRSPRTSKPDSVPMKFMPSRLWLERAGFGDQHRHALAHDARRRRLVGPDAARRVAMPLAVETGTVIAESRRVEPGPRARPRRSARWWWRRCRPWRRRGPVDRDARPEMAVGQLFQHHGGVPSLSVIDSGLPGPARRDPAREILQFVAVLVAGDQQTRMTTSHSARLRAVWRKRGGRSRGCRRPAPRPTAPR